MKKSLAGLCAALVTPYDSKGQVNYSVLRDMVSHLLRQGMEGFYVCGSTGEAWLLSAQERRSILEAVVEENAGRGIIIAHTGSIGTDLTLELTAHAKAVGADAISSVTPFYYKFSPAEIVQYYLDIAREGGMPTIAYNIPILTGYSLSLADVNRLAQEENLVGIKYTAMDLYLLERISQTAAHLTLYNGFDEIMLYGLLAGAHGGIGSTYNFMPERYLALRDAVRAQEIARAQELQHGINEMIPTVVQYGATQVAKELLTLQGFPCGDCRRPFAPLTEQAKADIKRLYEEKIRHA